MDVQNDDQTGDQTQGDQTVVPDPTTDDQQVPGVVTEEPVEGEGGVETPGAEAENEDEDEEETDEEEKAETTE